MTRLFRCGIHPLTPSGFRSEQPACCVCFVRVYSAVMRFCSRLSFWFSSSSFWLWCSSVFPLWRLWISKLLTASAGSGTALSETEPNLNWERGIKKKSGIKFLPLDSNKHSLLKQQGLNISCCCALKMDNMLIRNSNAAGVQHKQMLFCMNVRWTINYGPRDAWGAANRKCAFARKLGWVLVLKVINSPLTRP